MVNFDTTAFAILSTIQSQIPENFIRLFAFSDVLRIIASSSSDAFVLIAYPSVHFFPVPTLSACPVGLSYTGFKSVSSNGRDEIPSSTELSMFSFGFPSVCVLSDDSSLSVGVVSSGVSTLISVSIPLPSVGGSVSVLVFSTLSTSTEKSASSSGALVFSTSTASFTVSFSSIIIFAMSILL